MTDRTVIYRLQAEVSSFNAKIASAGASVRKSADDMTSATKESVAFRRGLDQTGATAGKAGLVAAVGLGAAIKAAIDWESAWTGVTKTVDGTTTQMAALESGLRDLATTLPATHEEIAGVAEAAGQLGVAREDILSFTKTMVDLGETTNLTAEEAATSIAQISNVMGTAGADVDNFGSTLVALGNDGASTEKQILDMAQRIAGTGAQIGLAETDILAIANAAASMGIEAEAGGSAISRVFTELAKATSSGGPKLEKFAETAGMTGAEFTKAFGEDPAAAFASFTGGLDRVNKSGGDVFTLLKSLGMSDVRVSQALLSMAASGDLLTNSLDLGKVAWEENTALTVEAEKRYGTTAAQIQIAWNEIKDAGIEAGGALLPVVSEVADVVGDMASAFGSLPGPVKDSVTGLAGVTAVLGGGLWFTAKTVSGVATMRSSLHDLGVTSAGTKGKLGSVSSFLGGPWGLALTTGVVALGYFAAKHGEAVASVNALRETLDEQTGAITENSREWAIKELSESGSLKSAQDLGLNLSLVTDAALGNKDAIAAVNDELDRFRYGATPDGMTFEQWNAMGVAAEDVHDILSDTNGTLEDARGKWELEAAAKGNSATASSDVATSSQAAAGGIATMGGAAALSAEDIKAMQDALDDARDSATDSAQGFVNLGNKVNDAKVSLGDWLRQLEKQADALRNFRQNAEQAANRGLRQGLIAALKEAGPEGALRMKQLANATDSEINRANKAWKRGQSEIDKYVDATVKVPEALSTTIKADTAGALSSVNAFEQRLRDIKDETVRIGTIYTSSGGGGTVGRGKAEGGYIAGPGTATSDSIPAFLSNGEYVIKSDAVNKYGTHMFDRLNAMHFAEGGLARLAAGGPVRSAGRAIQLPNEVPTKEIAA